MSSSITTKHNIQNLEEDTSVLYNLNPRSYLYNNCPEAGTQLGYIAEEVYDINKYLATYNSIDGPPVNINWDNIAVFTVEEVKKLKVTSDNSVSEIAKLNDIIIKQQNSIDDLLSRVQILEQNASTTSSDSG